jgi:ATP-binding cassette, subfamily B (MDR/TAP), member 1
MISTAFSTDSLSFQLAIGEKVSTLIMLTAMIFSGIGLSLYFGWVLALIILGFLPILILCWSFNIACKRAVFKEQDEIYLDSDGKAQESLGAISLVKQMNAEEFETKINQDILRTVGDRYWAAGLRYTAGAFLAILALYLGLTLAYWYGSECVLMTSRCPSNMRTRPYTAGTVVKIVYALFLPALSLNQLAPSLQKIAEGRAAASRIFKIVDRQPTIRSKEDAIVPETFRGIFRFDNVSFAYPKDKDLKILQNLSIVLDGRHAAIVGNSGCGKSTIFQLMMRFYDPDEGTVSLDGVDLRDLDLEWLRDQIGYVKQEPLLFATSIKENLLLSRPEASKDELEAALGKAQALEFVKELPAGLDTYVGSEGGQLSGGQKQRIAIARALLKRPKLLLLDEATSALDRKNEGLILNSLKNGSQ